MWGRKRQSASEAAPADASPGRLKETLRQVRIEEAERSGVVVDLHDAERARLELLNESLDPVFEEIPNDVDIFDRGFSHGDPPRLWIDMVAHVAMGRDKRQYRFLQDTRIGRRVLAETADVGEMAEAVTRYVATRLIERERALAADAQPLSKERELRVSWRHRGWRMVRAFLFGLVIGAVAVIAALMVIAARA
jgi:hypothetical protein